ncbi:MAG TPA: (Fe-S)-binding protein [Thermoanaerobaculaceae bacterium]|nr:(Fe-S)-binding protein [Thermoanaerobaculaceae bacterium]HPS77896.1 (Fe-S)-binding protein [Thermoanaerobaculaceae bacterium]
MTTIEARIDALTEPELQHGLEVFRSRLRAAEASYLNACVHCGLCAESCHYFRMEPTLENVPARKLDLVAAVFKRHFTAAGRLAPALVGARPFDREMVRAWLDAVFGRCSLCGRCSLNCTIGIALPRVFRAARAALAAMGLVPDDLQATVDNSLRHGNNMAITKEDWVDTVQWLEEELQMETGDPEARLPLDKHGAKMLFTVNPREPKFFPLSLQASAKVFWAAGEDWTLASDPGWDLTNYGLFNCNDDEAGRITQNLVDAMARLGCTTLVIGECGHGFGAARWEGPEWLQRAYPFEVRSVLEIMDEYLASGRIRVDPARHAKTVTLHDPCNLVRHGGIIEPQRRVLRQSVSRFVEMAPTREHNFCCGGGGGQLAMAAYRDRRIRSGGMKAQQIRDTGAEIVVAPCHNCIDQLMELNKEYTLGVQIKTVAEVVADALVTGEPLPTEWKGTA